MIRRLMLSVIALSLLVPAFARAQVFVPGYLRRDGTYVQPHYRSAPDGNPYNNYRRPSGMDPRIALEGRTPQFNLNAFEQGLRAGQDYQLRQLEIEERRRRLYSR